jgi:hypothetical protein
MRPVGRNWRSDRQMFKAENLEEMVAESRFGTTIVIEGNVGVIRVVPPAQSAAGQRY